MRRKICAGFLFILAALSSYAYSAEFALLDETPAPAPGSGEVTVTVTVSGLGDLAAPSLGAFDLTLTYDDAVFSFDSGDVRSEFGIASDGMSTAPGSITFYAVSLLSAATLDATQPDNLPLFTARFFPLVDGNGVFQLSVNSEPGDANGAPLSSTSAGPTTVGADINADAILPPPPAPIPTIPTAFTLLLILGLGLIGRKVLGERS